MKSSVRLIALITANILAGCNPRGVPVKFSGACSSDNHNRYVELSGFFGKSVISVCSTMNGSVRCRFPVYERPSSRPDESSVLAYIAQGTGANTVSKLESGFDPESIRIRDAAGKNIFLTGKVTLSGRLNTASDPMGCSIEVSKIVQ